MAASPSTSHPNVLFSRHGPVQLFSSGREPVVFLHHTKTRFSGVWNLYRFVSGAATGSQP